MVVQSPTRLLWKEVTAPAAFARANVPTGSPTAAATVFFYTDLGSALCYQNANEWLLWAAKAKLGHSPFVPSYAVEVLNLMLLKS
jgi:hypothetical protein